MCDEDRAALVLLLNLYKEFRHKSALFYVRGIQNFQKSLFHRYEKRKNHNEFSDIGGKYIWNATERTINLEMMYRYVVH